LLVCFLLPYDLQAQKYTSSDFVETQLPKPNSEEWKQILLGAYDFKVSIKKHKLRLEYWDSNDYDREPLLWVDKGRIVWTDNGEWGGELKFVDESDNRTIIKEGNIRFLFEYNKEIYFIESLAHMSLDEGAFFKLVLKDGVYNYEKIFDFGDAPEAMCMLNGDILVTSYDYLYRIHNLQKEVIFDLQKEGIFKNILNYEMLFTSVAASDEQHVYVGTLGGYLQFDLTNKSYKFYKFKNISRN